MTRRWLAALALLAACSGGGDEGSSGSGSASSADEETTTTTEEAPVDLELPTSFRAAADLDFEGFESTATAVVADPSRYELAFEDDLSFVHVVRDGARLFVRSGPDAATTEGRPYFEGTEDDSTALGGLREAARQGGIDDAFGPVSGAELAFDSIAELLLTDPGAVLDVDDIDLDGSFDVALPEEIDEALDDLDVDAPEVEALVEADDEALDRVEVRVRSDDVVIHLEIRYADQGDVDGADVAAPTADQIDATPWIDEEELATYQATPLLVPPAPPEGMALVGAIVLDAFESREGCQQVQLDYAPPDDPGSPDFVEYFLIDKSCMNQFDPTPFDETTGGLPSRYDGGEVLVGSTVVQIIVGDRRFDLDAFVPSLVPIAADALIASVVAPPD